MTKLCVGGKYCLVLLLLISCINPKINNENIDSRTGTFIKEIPEEYKGKIEELKKDAEKKLGLPNLENGSKNQTLHIWNGLVDDTLRMISLQQNNSVWELYFPILNYLLCLRGFQCNITGQDTAN
jgi:hypothetical protein